jgi:tRNA(Ile)-lysidine synthase
MTEEPAIATRHPVEARLADEWPPDVWGCVTILLAVSGGPDSVALLRAVHAIKAKGPGRIVVAHFNHRLRGPDADADEAFVADIAARLGLACECGSAPLEGVGSTGGEGLEAAARRARYQFLTQTADRLGARYVAVAHTADDQAETTLHRILRGTGLRGLSGMSRARPLSPAATLIRPLLGFRRQQLRDYLADLGQPFRWDASNSDLRRTRNRIRNQLLPELAARFNPHVVEALVRLGGLAGEAQTVVEAAAEQLADRVLGQCSADGLCIELRDLGDQPRYLLRELFMTLWRRQGWPLRSMGFQEWELLAAMALESARGVAAASPRRVFPGGILVEIGDGQLTLRHVAGSLRDRVDASRRDATT